MDWDDLGNVIMYIVLGILALGFISSVLTGVGLFGEHEPATECVGQFDGTIECFPSE